MMMILQKRMQRNHDRKISTFVSEVIEAISRMEVETGGICRQYGGRTTGNAPPSTRKDRIRLYVTQYKCDSAGRHNAKPAETYGL